MSSYIQDITQLSTCQYRENVSYPQVYPQLNVTDIF